jgi:hypothetical protein
MGLAERHQPPYRCLTEIHRASPELSTPTTLGSDVESQRLDVVSFCDGVLRVESEALLASWVGEPHLDDPRAGRHGGLKSAPRMGPADSAVAHRGC